MLDTLIDVLYPRDHGRITLRGNLAPLSWEKPLEPTHILEDAEGTRHRFELQFPEGELIEFKARRDDQVWSRERNYTMLAGETLVVAPYFDQSHASLEPTSHTLQSHELGYDVTYRLLLPPSYAEHTTKRYPVLYAHDGQSLFAATPDPGDPHSWCMDQTLSQLFEYGAVEELIVVGITTREHRLEMLTPTADPAYGGGRAKEYLQFITETLKPTIDDGWRTLKGRQNTAMIGSSLGGLFSFYSAWNRPNVFGRVACLSASFWWDDRRMIRDVKSSCPLPRPWLYVDSGAALSEFEQDVNVRDGFDHTQAMCKALVNHCYEAGTSLHSLTFAGFGHDSSAWAARLATPLQLLFPRRG